MKITASILVMYFGLLMMQPFANMDMTGAKPVKACASDQCCKNEQHKGQSPVKHQSTCNADLCNPFVPCGLSIVLQAHTTVFANPVFDLSKIKKPALKNDILSDYLADCWRPPELLS